MDIVQFIGFIIMMIASVILSRKTKKEKKESLDMFEEMDKQIKIFKQPVEDEEEEEEDDEEFTVSQQPPPMPQPTQIVVKPQVSRLPPPSRPIIKPQMPQLTEVVTIPEVAPTLPSGPIVPKIHTFKDENIFDMHKKAFVQKGVEITKPINVLGKLESLQEAIVIQTILNKPKGW